MIGVNVTGLCTLPCKTTTFVESKPLWRPTPPSLSARRHTSSSAIFLLVFQNTSWSSHAPIPSWKTGSSSGTSACTRYCPPQPQGTAGAHYAPSATVDVVRSEWGHFVVYANGDRYWSSLIG
ncbi:hypothetical protein SLEP1_g19872 [Rubroshorea leprosula]|uniref:Uncharacterized protein n=1 Tax=Rubroshorea leprosula TaxID=152421 RepID=A0AAV5J9Z1_9ROSI|nr:hypothetical protein SLEP1_g19872 [Rubroshorea leprosula]